MYIDENKACLNLTEEGITHARKARYRGRNYLHRYLHSIEMINFSKGIDKECWHNVPVGEGRKEILNRKNKYY